MKEDKPPKIFKSVTYIPKLSERLQGAECIDDDKYQIAPRTCNTLQGLFTNLKTKIDTMDKSNVVYQIKCNGNNTTKCDKVYIGTTKNKLKTRISGHKSDIKQRHQTTAQKTALAMHCTALNHNPDLERVRVVATENRYGKRMFLEMLNIINITTTKRINYKSDMDNCAQNYRHLIRRVNGVQ